MMTSEERLARCKSLLRLSSILFDASHEKWCRRQKILAYNTLLEPPASIETANETFIKRLDKESYELRELSDKVREAYNNFSAKPYLISYESSCGTWETFVAAGSLPNGVKTSTDESEAMKMYAAYKAGVKFEPLPEEELPF